MWKFIVAISLAGLIASLVVLVDANVRFGTPHADRHAQIEDVLPGSPAEHVGLQRGDIVLAVDGLDTAYYELHHRIACGCAAFRTRVLTVEREGVAFELAIRAEQRQIGIHFTPATRYELDLASAVQIAYRSWQQQAYAPGAMLAGLAKTCPFGAHHVMPLQSPGHHRAAIVGIVLFWGSLIMMFGAFGFAIRRRHSATASL